MYLPAFIPLLMPLILFGAIAMIVIPFTEARVCRNCGLILT